MTNRAGHCQCQVDGPTEDEAFFARAHLSLLGLLLRKSLY